SACPFSPASVCARCTASCDFTVSLSSRNAISLHSAMLRRGSNSFVKNKRPAICRPFPCSRFGLVGLFLHLKLALDYVILRLLLRGVRAGAGGGAGIDIVRSAGGLTCGAALLVEHLAERVRRGFELLDGALDRLRVGPLGLLAGRLDRLRQRALVGVGQL